MPRIAVAAGTLALMAGAIGLNMARYPAVWEMTAEPPHLSQADQSTQAVPTLASAERRESHAAAAPQRYTAASQANSADLQSLSSGGRSSPASSDVRPAARVDLISQHRPVAAPTAADQREPSSVPSTEPLAQYRRERDTPATAPPAQAVPKQKATGPPPAAPWPAETAAARKSLAGGLRPRPDAPAGRDRPLVPVVDPGVQPDPAAATLEGAVRRLPPVELAPVIAAGRDQTVSLGPPAPPYPSTGVE